MPAKILASLSILMLVFSASTLMAEQPADKGNIKKSDTLNFVLMDCGNLDCGRDPQQIGTVISFENSTGFPRVLALVGFLNLEGEEQAIGLNFQADQIPFQVEGATGGDCTNCVWFESTDCDETNTNEPGYLKVDPGLSFSPTFKPFAVVGEHNQSEVRELWISTSTVAQNITGRSRQEPNFQGCVTSDPVGPAFSAIPAELIDPDLQTTFKPPYTLELK